MPIVIQYMYTFINHQCLILKNVFYSPLIQYLEITYIIIINFLLLQTVLMGAKANISETVQRLPTSTIVPFLHQVAVDVM